MALKIAILESGRTQRLTAKRARIDETRLSRIIKGEGTPTKTERRRLARAIGRQEAELFQAEAGA